MGDTFSESFQKTRYATSWVRKSPTGSTITYITDPWGTRLEIVQRAPLGPAVQQP